MVDSNREQELMAEIQELRTQVRRLTAKCEGQGPTLKERASRSPLKTEIEIVGDFDILEAIGVDISDTGICFELKKQLFFDMRFMQGERLVEKRARLVWVKYVDDERARLGFHFVETDIAEVEGIIRRIEGV